MPFEKGRKKQGGRPKGQPNKSAARLVDDIVNAFKRSGGEEYLMDLAKNDRKTFCTLLAKIIPTNIQADIGVDGEIRIVRKVIKGIAE